MKKSLKFSNEEENVKNSSILKEIDINIKMLKIYNNDNLNEFSLFLSNSKQNFYIKRSIY